jgi:hypothetical protein
VAAGGCDERLSSRSANGKRDVPAPAEGFVLTHFMVAAGVARSGDFYSGVLGGKVVLDGEPTIVKLASGWVISNVGGDRPMTTRGVVLVPPADPTRASAFLNLRVADIHGVYQEWRSRGAEFLTPPPKVTARRSAATCTTRRAPDRGRPDDRRAHLSQVA